MSGKPIDVRERDHFIFLDGMRGLAALAVATLHACHEYRSSYLPDHAGLAVDFFFVLSGFVVAYAYDDRLAAGLRVGEFAIRRLIRLYPMIAFGALLGAGRLMFEEITAHKSVAGSIGVGLTAMAMIPLGLLTGRSAFPANVPLWSLFFEIAANAVYGLLAKLRLQLSWLIIAALGASAALYIWTAWHFASIADVGFDGIQKFLFGFVRVTFPYLAGVAIFRFRLFAPRWRVPDVAVAAILLAVLLQPYLPVSWVYDCLCAIILFPTIVTLGAGVSGSSLNPVWAWLGRISYPLYLVHDPVLRLVHLAFLDLMPARVAYGLPVALLVAVAAAQLALSLYDEPARKLLTQIYRRVSGRSSGQMVPIGDAPPA
jgi:peptidoglycan/LPS O-acetylase OafA/YrhL